MSEAIIARGGRKGSGGGSDFHGLMTEVYTSSTMWLVPSNAVNNEFSVRIFGGGGGGFGGNGGINFGGGGGYGADGGSNNGGGGGYGKGGYGGNGYIYTAGGGGAYGCGGSYMIMPKFGGGGATSQSGADGICIIQYYVS